MQANTVYFGTIHQRATAVGMLDRTFLLEEVVYRQYESWEVVPAGPGYFAASAKWGETWAYTNALRFQVSGIKVHNENHDGRILIIHAPNAASAKEVREEIALAQTYQVVFDHSTDLHEVFERWEYSRAEEAAADAEASGFCSEY